ncbi:MAG: N-acetylmuramoyl-L-alanine amidase [Clostridiaceae bacterium]|nr:N-acetylmuramoyl-L-alanine amidase [Clostridiaceae bacterium]
MKRFLVLLILVSIFVLTGSVQIYAQEQLYSGFRGTRSNALVAVNGSVIELERKPIIIDGRIVIPARTIFDEVRVRTDWYEQQNKVVLSSDYTTVVMFIGSTKAFINGVNTVIEAPPVIDNGTVMVPLRFSAEAFNMKIGWDERTGTAFIGDKPVSVSKDDSTKRNYIVVVDAGHGGKDPGAVYGGVKEKDLNLDIANRLNKLLINEGIKTYMTRGSDSYIDLYSRSGLANRVNADLLVSVHNNAGYKKYSGSMTLYYPGSSKTKGKLSSQEFANIVQKNMVQGLGSSNLGIVPRPSLAVLRTSNMPAVIAEVGYMTNESELGRLKTSAYKQKAAEALKNSVLESLNKMYK